MEPPLDAVAHAHRRLVEVIADLTDAQVAEPSLLPGWTRGHVPPHLADAARARGRVVEHRSRGERVALWEPGERVAIIEATASLDAAGHRAATAEMSGRLERAWAGVADWSAPVDPDEDDPVPPVFTRWREVWIHLLDLDLGVRPAEWSAEFAVHTVGVLRPRLPAGVSLRATDMARTWLAGTEVAGGVRDLAAWPAARRAADLRRAAAAAGPVAVVPGAAPGPAGLTRRSPPGPRPHRAERHDQLAWTRHRSSGTSSRGHRDVKRARLPVSGRSR